MKEWVSGGLLMAETKSREEFVLCCIVVGFMCVSVGICNRKTTHIKIFTLKIINL